MLVKTAHSNLSRPGSLNCLWHSAPVTPGQKTKRPCLFHELFSVASTLTLRTRPFALMFMRRLLTPEGTPEHPFCSAVQGLPWAQVCESFPYGRLPAKDLLCSHELNSDGRVVESSVKTGQRQSALVIPEQPSGWLRWLSGHLDCLCSFSLGF